MESNYGEQQVIPTLKYSNASNRKRQDPGMLPTKQSTATSRYPLSKMKYTSPEADTTQESTTATTH